MRADRWREPLADPDQDRAAARHPRADLRLHLLLHAVLERVHLRADLPAIDPEQDGAGRDRQRVCRWRHLPLGRADGGRVGGVAAARNSLCLLRRALRVGHDRSREGIGARAGALRDKKQNKKGVGSCTSWSWERPAWSAANWSNGCCVTAGSAKTTSAA